MCESVTEFDRDHQVNPAEGWNGPHRPEWEERLVCRQPTARDTIEFCRPEPEQAAASLRMTSALFLCRLVEELPASRATVHRVTALCLDSVLAACEGDFDTAEDLVDEGGHLAARHGDSALLALVAEASGYLAVFEGDLRTAVHCFEDALRSARAESDVPSMSTLLGAAVLHGLLGDERRSRARREEALAIAATRGEPAYRATA